MCLLSDGRENRMLGGYILGVRGKAVGYLVGRHSESVFYGATSCCTGLVKSEIDVT